MLSALLRLAKRLLARVAPGWHPSRNPLVGHVLSAWASHRRPEVLTTKHGFDLYVPAEDRSPIVVSLLLEGEYEPEETRAMQSLLRPGDVAIDVGANVGYMSCLMARRVGEAGAIYAFEPEPCHAAALRRNAALNGMPQLRCYQLALSDKGEQVPLYLNPDNPGDHTLVALEERDSIDIETLSFDSFWKRTGDSRPIRLVKIDVQGHELAVIRGMQRTLTEQQIESLLIEIWPYRLEEGGPSCDHLMQALMDLTWTCRILSCTEGIEVHNLEDIRRVAAERSSDRHLSFNVLLQRRG
ncbi:MAG: FkbM family methyltransferase [Thermoanaerobaculia bacterium]|nr:FkbM family methyltransferase [Thermoanaerobaculia bacterium]